MKTASSAATRRSTSDLALDPKSGEIKLLTPPASGARPYGIEVDSKNVVYFVEFGAPKVGAIDPKTLAIREFPLPDPAARSRRLAIGPG